MTASKPFGYRGKPGTCLWCGGKLRRIMIVDPGSTEPYPGNLIMAAKAGPYQDDHFDTLTCGYRFGNRMAGLGRRLEASTVQEEKS